MNLRKLLSSLGLFMLLLLSFAAVAQERVVSGKVTDSTGRGIPGVSVSVKGQATRGTTTSASGDYSITVPASATTLVFSSVGYTYQEIDITARNSVSPTLQAAVGSGLNEIVVVGYGTSRRRELTGAISTVSSKDFVKGPITTPEQLISGKVAGVQITSNGGAPGAGSQIRIRGGASLTASNDPLIVIDGVPVDGGVAGSANPLSLVNPNDIETFTILKDPSAAAIYGSRGSNGVILITTKKGARGKLKLNFNTQVFAQTRTNEVDVLSADEFRQVVGAKGSSADAAKLGAASTNWQDEIFHTAFGQDFNLSASGAAINGKLPFRVSGGYLNQDGILRTGNFKRQSLAINLSPRFFKDQLRVDVNLKGSRTTNRFADEGAIGAAITFDPTQPVRVNSRRFGGFFEYLEPSTVIGFGGFIPKDLSPRNPVGLLEQRNDKSEVYRSIGNIQFDYSIPFVKGLRANLNLGYDYQHGEGTIKISDSAASTYRRYSIGKTAAGRDSVFNYGGTNNYYQAKQRNLLLDFYLNYAKDITSIKSRVDFTAGYGYQDFKFFNYAYSDFRYNGVARENSAPTFPESDPQYILISYYSRLTYTLNNKYVVNLVARTDGSSKYNKDDRWGFFPSAGIAWRISEESFLKNSRTVSDLKLRLSYGVTGQQSGFSFYNYIPRYALSNNQAQYLLGNTYYGMYRPAAYDPDFKWETTRNLNAAVDFALFDNRLSGSVDVFKRKTVDLISAVPVPLGTNFTNVLLQNVGNVESKGIEVGVNVTAIRRRDFTWDLNYNFTYVDPEVTKLLFNPDPKYKGSLQGGISGGTGNSIQIHSVGYTPFSYFVWKQVYDQNGKPIDGLYEDLNRDGVINDDDKYRYQAPQQRIFMGMSTNLAYKKVSGGFTMRASLDNYNYNNVQSNLGVRRGIINPLGYLNNGSRDYLNTNFENNQYFSDYYVQNASFLRMDNLNLGYDVGEIFRKSRLRIAANVQNVFVITKYDGIDPEINGGIDNQFYPRPRTYTISFNLDF